MIDNYKASELTDKLSAAFGNVKEEKTSIIKYNESTQTYYADEALAKQHVRQISKEDIKTAETKKTLDSYMKELEKKLPEKDKWHSKRPRSR